MGLADTLFFRNGASGKMLSIPESARESPQRVIGGLRIMSVSLPCVRYQQGGRTVFVTAPTLKEILAVLPPREDPDVISDTNRRMTPAHGKGFGDYVWATEDWISGALMAGVDEGNMEFHPGRGGGSYGTVEIADGANIRLFDGQHRRYGLQYAIEREIASAEIMVREGTGVEEAETRLKRADALMAESIPVIFYEETDILALRQMYSDISHVRVPDAITTAVFDTRNPFNVSARTLAETHPLLVGRIDSERNALGAKASQLLTLNQLSKLLQILFYGITVRRITPGSEPEVSTIIERGTAFFDDLVSMSDTMKAIEQGTQTVVDARERGDLTVNVTTMKIIAGAWRELVAVKQAEREEVAEYFSSVPQVPTADKEAVWVRAGVLAPTTEKRAPYARTHEVSTAVELLVKEFEPAAA
jgi:DGQHR domain-containing protein